MKASRKLSLIPSSEAARFAELDSLPVRVVKLTDAEAIEAQVVELSVVVKSLPASGGGDSLASSGGGERGLFRGGCLARRVVEVRPEISCLRAISV